MARAHRANAYADPRRRVGISYGVTHAPDPNGFPRASAYGLTPRDVSELQSDTAKGNFRRGLAMSAMSASARDAPVGSVWGHLVRGLRRSSAEGSNSY